MTFSYYNPVHFSFIKYQDAFKQIQTESFERIILITTQGFTKRPIYQDIKHILGDKITKTLHEIPSNPELSLMQSFKKTLPPSDLILALGGGSVMDAAKFFSVQGEIIAQQGQLLIEKSSSFTPIYAFPTTAGTSSELTAWATLWDTPSQIKYSLHDVRLYPKKAFYDPSLMLTLPLELSIHTALDALSHAIESIWNKNTNPISITHAKTAIELILHHLPSLPDHLESLHHRQALILASIHAGLAFSNTQTALAHAISYPITMNFKIPHGLACSFTLPLLMKQLPEGMAKDILIGYLKPIETLFETLHISTRLSDYGIKNQDITNIFSHLNARAKNGIFDLDQVHDAFIKELNSYS